MSIFRRPRDHEREISEAEQKLREQTTPGAQAQIDALDHRMRNWTKAIMVVVALIGVGFVLTGWQINRTLDHIANERDDRIEAVSKFSVELRNGLVASCEKNGNPLREAVQGMIEEEIRQSKPGLLRQFFPDVPPELLENIIAKQTARKQAVIAEIEPVSCAALYPEPDPDEPGFRRPGGDQNGTGPPGSHGDSPRGSGPTLHGWGAWSFEGSAR